MYNTRYGVLLISYPITYWVNTHPGFQYLYEYRQYSYLYAAITRICALKNTYIVPRTRERNIVSRVTQLHNAASTVRVFLALCIIYTGRSRRAFVFLRVADVWREWFAGRDRDKRVAAPAVSHARTPLIAHREIVVISP